MYGPSRLNNDVATSLTLIHSSGTARVEGYTRHCGRSFPCGFPTQIPYIRCSLLSVRFLFLPFDFLRFSFFLLILLKCCLCMPLNMLSWLLFSFPSASMSCVTFVILASIHSICFTLKLWANSSPCFKASPLDWKSVESCFFKFSIIMTFNFSTSKLFFSQRLVRLGWVSQWKQGKTLFQDTVISVRLKSLQISTFEKGENYSEFLKLSCQEKVGEICSFCCEWTGPHIERCP